MDENENGIIDDSQITSTDFDYDIYSGGSAMEYLKKENERKKRERDDAGKTAGMRKREEYERRFAGMSPDELFDDRPKKKKEPEDDFSDFFDADEIERQQQKVREFEQEKHSTPKVENMMPGEDTPSSQQSGMTREEGIEAAAVMLAQQNFRREREDARFHRSRRTRYYRSWILSEITDSMLDSIGVGDRGKSIFRHIIWYITGFLLAMMLYAGITHTGLFKMTSGELISGAAGGLVCGLLYQLIMERDSFLKALVHVLADAVLLVVIVVAALFMK